MSCQQPQAHPERCGCVPKGTEQVSSAWLAQLRAEYRMFGEQNEQLVKRLESAQQEILAISRTIQGSAAALGWTAEEECAPLAFLIGKAMGCCGLEQAYKEARHAFSVIRYKERELNSEVERLRQFERVCAGLAQECIDGGYTVAEHRKHCKRVEDELVIQRRIAREQEKLIELMQPNAERYLWFRKECLPNGLGVYEEELDAAIDAGIADDKAAESYVP